jgi:hypothetical protein
MSALGTAAQNVQSMKQIEQSKEKGKK